MHNHLMTEFIAARKALLRWRAAKRKASLVAELHFPRSHPLRKSVENACNTLGEFRYQADVAACRHADNVGDQVFNREVDAVLLQNPTEWFYGASLRFDEEHNPAVKIDRNVQQGKCLDIFELSVMHEVGQRGREFMEAVNRLPTGARINSAAGRRLAQSQKGMSRNYQRMLMQLGKTRVDHTKTYGVLLCLSHMGLGTDLCRGVIGFIA